jgi:hypothetical protein
MSTPDRAETNRRNGQKRMGARSVGGKNRSRLNALKHGMTAALPVIPGEDGEALEGRIDTGTDDLRPRSLLESHFIEQAAKILWQLERVERADVAKLTTNTLNAEADETLQTEDYVDELAERLFGDRLGPVQLDPNCVSRNGVTPLCETNPASSTIKPFCETNPDRPPNCPFCETNPANPPICPFCEKAEMPAETDDDGKKPRAAKPAAVAGGPSRANSMIT